MSQTVKIRAGYSETVTKDYNSQRYSIELEGDINLNGNGHKKTIEEASQKMFATCKSLIAHEKDSSQTVNDLFENGDNEKPQFCSQKQIDFIKKLCLRKKKNVVDVIFGQWEKENLEDLTLQEASKTIEELRK
ncbi:MAG: hypothetical protein ABIA63_10800 [bacterium]